ncbi:MAG: helix-turn-helix domain-containing protein [Hominenteromicrobium sp.]
MAVSYMKLWHLLLDRKMTKGDLEKAAGVSHYTMTQMGKEKDVSTEALRNICTALNCELNDIIEFIKDEKQS